jgi:hemin uptake protein HemP
MYHDGKLNTSQQPQQPQGFTDNLPMHDARALVGDGTQARIALDGQIYTLRITRQGKLILTK